MNSRATDRTGRGSRRTHLTAGLAAVLLTAGLAGCGDEPDDRLPATPPPLQTPTPEATTGLDPADAEAAEEILEAFDTYMEALIELSTDGVDTAGLAARLNEARIIHELFDEVFQLLGENFTADLAAAGAPTWTAEVVGIDWDHAFEHRPDQAIPAATLRVCYDDSEWTTVDKATGEVVAGPGERYVSTVTARLIEPDEHRGDEEPAWYIASRDDGSEPC